VDEDISTATALISCIDETKRLWDAIQAFQRKRWTATPRALPDRLTSGSPSTNKGERSASGILASGTNANPTNRTVLCRDLKKSREARRYDVNIAQAIRATEKTGTPITTLAKKFRNRGCQFDTLVTSFVTGARSNANMATRRPATNDVLSASKISASGAEFRVILRLEVIHY
jgi:hypothetical protein